MIEKIGTVMGLKSVKDPDPSYVLTVDNVIKILAIQMRFRYIMALSHPKLHALIHLVFLHRCNIPVVIMGETGCGKTRLIRYMCDLVAHSCKNGEAHVRSMLIMKVWWYS